MSAAYRRMFLVNEGDYKRCQQRQPPPPPPTKTELPIDQVQKLHAHALENERNQLETMTEKLTTVQKATPPPLSVAMIKLIIDKFPLHARARGHGILQKILTQQPQISWDSEGQIQTTDEGVLPHSNIIDLIYYAAAAPKQPQLVTPVGWDQFTSLTSRASQTTARMKKKNTKKVITPAKFRMEMGDVQPTTRKRTRLHSPAAELLFSPDYQDL